MFNIRFLSNGLIQLAAIVVAQFLCLSTWFAGSLLWIGLPAFKFLSPWLAGILLNGVQLGFVLGTALSFYLEIANRYSSNKLFALSCLWVAMANALVWLTADPVFICISRIAVGFGIAGVYPIGMKIIIDQFGDRAYRFMGWIVFALTLGSGLPHLIISFTPRDNYSDWVIGVTSAAALAAGVIMWFLRPIQRSKSKIEELARDSVSGFANVRITVLGYLGHMWELYAFWTFLPFLVRKYIKETDASMICFAVMLAGALGCILPAVFRGKLTNKNYLLFCLMLSALCCFIQPMIPVTVDKNLILLFLLIWGWVVIADSPLFSANLGRVVPHNQRGGIMTLSTSLGFALAMISVQSLTHLNSTQGLWPYFGWFLLPGPLMAWWLVKRSSSLETVDNVQGA